MDNFKQALGIGKSGINKSQDAKASKKEKSEGSNN